MEWTFWSGRARVARHHALALPGNQVPLTDVATLKYRGCNTRSLPRLQDADYKPVERHL